MERSNPEVLFPRLFPFWDALSPQDRSALLDAACEETFPRGARIADGGAAPGILFVRSGCLRLYLLSEEGREVTLCRLFPGELCVLAAAEPLRRLAKDLFTDAEEESDCVLIDGQCYAELASRVPDARAFALERAAERFSEILRALEQILFTPFDKRLAAFLVKEAERGETDRVALTHEQIARHLGSAREVVSRTLKRFAAARLVEVSRKGVRILDRTGLLALAG